MYKHVYIREYMYINIVHTYAYTNRGLLLPSLVLMDKNYKTKHKQAASLENKHS